jgi:membrane peptidoglycan carboxypeptidase
MGSDSDEITYEKNDNNSCITVSNEQIPTFLSRCITYQEDRSFYEQERFMPTLSNWHGISLASTYRIFSGGGGSNINMQLIKNEAFPNSRFPKDFQRKFAELISAYQLSLQLPPDEIMIRYLNRVAFCGGKNHQGIALASLSTFNRMPKQLNELEIIYLVSTLKRSTSLKVDSGYILYDSVSYNLEKVKNSLIKMAKFWEGINLISENELSKIEKQELRFGPHMKNDVYGISTKDFLVKRKNQDRKGTYYTSLSCKVQEGIQNALNSFEDEFKQYMRKDGCELYTASVIIDVDNGKIIGHHGSKNVTDLTDFFNGFQIGSLIKPFILLELLESRGLNQNFVLYDGPIAGKRTPNNYSCRYSNEYVPIEVILPRSLNAPMVNIRELVDPIELYKDVEDRFTKMIPSVDRYLDLSNEDLRLENEINYPLGSRRMTLLDIAQLYQTLFNNGQYIELSVIDSFYDPVSNSKLNNLSYRTRIYSYENASFIKNVLIKTMRPGGTGTHFKGRLKEQRTYYAKTGTTDGANHGYTVLSDGRLLILTFVTYAKTKDNILELNNTPPIPFESGAKTAGTLAAYIYNEITARTRH